jgi:hypothetical protein
MDYLIYLLPVPVMILWMIGGQFLKGARRFGVPGISTIVLILNKFFGSSQNATEEREKRNMNMREWVAIGVYAIVLPFLLAVGYGESSWLRRVLGGNDLTTRATYGTMLSLPIGVYIMLTPVSPWKYGVIVVALILAFLVRAGSLGKIGKYDVLVEDIVRSLTFGGSLVFVLV